MFFRKQPVEEIIEMSISIIKTNTNNINVNILSSDGNSVTLNCTPKDIEIVSMSMDLDFVDSYGKSEAIMVCTRGILKDYLLRMHRCSCKYYPLYEEDMKNSYSDQFKYFIRSENGNTLIDLGEDVINIGKFGVNHSHNGEEKKNISFS